MSKDLPYSPPDMLIYSLKLRCLTRTVPHLGQKAILIAVFKFALIPSEEALFWMMVKTIAKHPITFSLLESQGFSVPFCAAVSLLMFIVLPIIYLCCFLLTNFFNL